MKTILLNDLAARNPGLARFDEIVPAQRGFPAPPDFLFGSPNADVLSSYFRHEWVHAQGVWRLYDATVYAPYLIKLTDEFVSIPWANLHATHLETEINARLPLPSETRQLDGVHALICGPGYAIFGHWLVDFLPKLYVLEAAGFDLGKMKFLVPSNTPGFVVELLAICGISPSQLVPFGATESLRGEILIPTTPHNGVQGPLYADVARFLRRRIGVRAGGGTPQSLFISRAKTSQSRPCRNREAIERIAQDAGLAIVYPEQLPLSEQFRLYAAAKLVVGEYGSSLHCTLFSEPGTIVCALRGSRDHPGFIQTAIGRALYQPTGYVFGVTEPDDPRQAFSVPERPFLECISILTRSPVFGFVPPPGNH